MFLPKRVKKNTKIIEFDIETERFQFGLCRFQNLLDSILACNTHMYKSYEPHHEKTCFCHMLTTKAQISLHIWMRSLISAFVSLPR